MYRCMCYSSCGYQIFGVHKAHDGGEAGALDDVEVVANVLQEGAVDVGHVLVEVEVPLTPHQRHAERVTPRVQLRLLNRRGQ